MFFFHLRCHKKKIIASAYKEKEEKEEDYIPGSFKVWMQHNQNHLGKKPRLVFLCITLDIERMITTFISKL